MTPTPDPKAKRKQAEPTPPREPQQSQIDQERGDWEGMGQSRFQPEEETLDPAAEPKGPPPRT